MVENISYDTYGKRITFYTPLSPCITMLLS